MSWVGLLNPFVPKWNGDPRCPLLTPCGVRGKTGATLNRPNSSASCMSNIFMSPSLSCMAAVKICLFVGPIGWRGEGPTIGREDGSIGVGLWWFTRVSIRILSCCQVESYGDDVCVSFPLGTIHSPPLPSHRSQHRIEWGWCGLVTETNQHNNHTHNDNTRRTQLVPTRPSGCSYALILAHLIRMCECCFVSFLFVSF